MDRLAFDLNLKSSHRRSAWLLLIGLNANLAERGGFFYSACSITQPSGHNRRRLAAAFLLVWVNAAVGIVGAAGNDANMMYWGVLAVGFIGAIIARFRPGGLTLALVATAGVQVVVALIAVIAGWGQPASGALEVLGLNGAFVALWLAAAGLFWRAKRGGSTPS